MNLANGDEAARRRRQGDGRDTPRGAPVSAAFRLRSQLVLPPTLETRLIESPQLAAFSTHSC